MPGPLSTRPDSSQHKLVSKASTASVWVVVGLAAASCGQDGHDAPLAAMNNRARPRGLADIMQVTANLYQLLDHPLRELGTK